MSEQQHAREGKAAPWEGGAWDFGPGGKRGKAGWGQAEAEVAPGMPAGKGPGTPPKAAVYMPPKRKNDQFSRGRWAPSVVVGLCRRGSKISPTGGKLGGSD